MKKHRVDFFEPRKKLSSDSLKCNIMNTFKMLVISVLCVMMVIAGATGQEGNCKGETQITDKKLYVNALALEYHMDNQLEVTQSRCDVYCSITMQTTCNRLCFASQCHGDYDEYRRCCQCLCGKRKV